MTCCCCAAEVYTENQNNNFYNCEHCGHQWTLANSELSLQHYTELSGRNSMPAEYLNKKLDERVAFLLPLLKKGSRILEVGCAEGDLGKILKQKIDIHYTGIELSNDALAAEKVLDKVIREPNVFLGEHKFDLIISFHVLEHIVEPWNNVVNWKRMLSTDGYVVVEVPNQSGHPFIGFDNNPEHIHQFSVASLATLFQRAAFNVKSVETGYFESPTYCDSIRMVAVKSLTKNEQEKRLLARILTIMKGEFCIYGLGGDFSNYLYPLLAQLPVSDLYDGDNKRRGSDIGQYHVKSFDEASYTGQSILISSIRFQNEIKETLCETGVPENKIFYLSDVLKVE